MNTPDFPTPWQRKTLWAAATAVGVVVIGIIAMGIVWLIFRILSFLQPILIPFAVAGVFAYLLDPVVSKVCSWGTSRHRAVLAVFAVVTVFFAGLLVWVVPAVSEQSIFLARKVPGIVEISKKRIIEGATYVQKQYGVALVPQVLEEETTRSGVARKPLPDVPETPEETLAEKSPATSPGNLPLTPGLAAADHPKSDPTIDLQHLLSGDWLQGSLVSIGNSAWTFVRTSVGGFLGVLGFLLSLVIVPVYLYYFLIESRTIAATWHEYVPIRASAFKDEVVSVLREINGYLIAFFRGQLVVSVINGAATGLGLVAIGLDFGLLIGLILVVLGFIPYLGIILSWIPAVIIASVQGGSWIAPASAPWWVLPLIVTAIFAIVQQIDALFITPKIVGDSVGLHPMTVIFSVFVWSLLLGGLLGAILAVPLTATMKVLLKRYIWQRRFLGEDDNLSSVSARVASSSAAGSAAAPPVPAAPAP